MCPVNAVTESPGGSLQGDSTSKGGRRSSFLEPPARWLLSACDPQFGKPPVEAAGAVDAENASTAPWKTAKNAVSHSYHRPLLLFGNPKSVTYVPG